MRSALYNEFGCKCIKQFFYVLALWSAFRKSENKTSKLYRGDFQCIEESIKKQESDYLLLKNFRKYISITFTHISRLSSAWRGMWLTSVSVSNSLTLWVEAEALNKRKSKGQNVSTNNSTIMQGSWSHQFIEQSFLSWAENLIANLALQTCPTLDWLLLKMSHILNSQHIFACPQSVCLEGA